MFAGDAVQPGSLLQPAEGSSHNSITVLLPDGQRILYECFTVKDCARGFRVPALYRTPDPFAVEMLARIRAALIRGYSQQSRLPRDEAVAVLGPGNRVQVGGLAADLANGRYTYDLQPLNPEYSSQFHLALEKKSRSITLALPASGLYLVKITDDLNTPRIDLLVAAVEPAQAPDLEKSFREAQTLLKDWNGNYDGWPIHAFQRAYLESLMLRPKPRAQGPKAGKGAAMNQTRGQPAADEIHRPGVTAEPQFYPKPGVFDGDTAVTVRCATPGAVMHYTVDGSEPIDGSSVYGAPVMVKGTELTIKAFASAPGRRDSPVVTGIFRIRQ